MAVGRLEAELPCGSSGRGEAPAQGLALAAASLVPSGCRLTNKDPVAIAGVGKREDHLELYLAHTHRLAFFAPLGAAHARVGFCSLKTRHC